MSEAGGFDSREMRHTLGRFPTGVTIVTCLGPDGAPVGMTANSFASVSLEPPLVLWSVDRSARSFEAFAAAERFAFSVLAQDQAELSNRFAKPGADKFAGVAMETAASGVPLIADCAARIECERHAVFDGGDHLIVVGRVTAMVRSDRRSLVFAEGRYGVVAPHPGTIKDGAADPADLHPYDDFLVPLLFRAYNHMFRALSGTLDAEEATGAEMRILAILAAGGPGEDEALLTGTMLSQSRYQEARQSLLASALVTEMPGALAITAAGRARLADLVRRAAGLERRSTGGLDRTEVEMLRTLLRKLVHHHEAG